MKGRILNIQRMSTEDGPGLRTTVFLKGCSLKCNWCHNPESIKPKKEFEWFGTRCIGCQSCIKACKQNAIKFTQKGIIFDEQACIKCLACAEECPTNAIEVKGIDWEATNIFKELVKDKAYFGKEGGVTLSGGEALYQADFAIELCKLLKKEGLHVAIDTCGQIKYEKLEKSLEYVDLFLYDVKLMNPDLHKKYTGVDNTLILENLKKLAEKIIKNKSSKLWIRTPIIPDSTSNLENIKAIKKFINENIYEAVERWELCAFNNLCSSKYQRLGRVWQYEGVEKIDKDSADLILEAAKKDSKISNITYLTGSLKL